MTFPNSKEEKTSYSKNSTTNTINSKLKPEEQAMNGLYGMPETDIENKNHQKKKFEKYLAFQYHLYCPYIFQF